MLTTVLLGLTSFEKNWGPVDFWGGASDFSNLLGQWLQELNVEGCSLITRHDVMDPDHRVITRADCTLYALLCSKAICASSFPASDNCLFKAFDAYSYIVIYVFSDAERANNTTILYNYTTHPSRSPLAVPGILGGLMSRTSDDDVPNSAGGGPTPMITALFRSTSRFSNMLSRFSMISNGDSSTSSVLVLCPERKRQSFVKYRKK